VSGVSFFFLTVRFKILLLKMLLTCRFGRIVSIKAIIDKKSSKCKGFGFVMYESIEEAMNAMEGLLARGYSCAFAKVGIS
jgi:hypothetical protein